ncbi:MAG: CAP domain-containing protein [Acidobacteriota bacterium]|nr:CAP domain-containing protein [Acidobacteriota bacterium]
MQTVKTAAFWQILVVLFLLAAVAHVPGQTGSAKNDKPQAILIASWRENQPAPNSRVSDSRLASAKNTKFNLAPNSVEREAFDLINAARRRANLPPLVFDAEMLYLAREHSVEMANSGKFSHRGAYGEMVDERARNVGITGWRGIGENIAANQYAKNPVATAIECWLNSEGHRRNLLSPDWSRSGIGVAVSPDGKYYFTQVFRD